MNKFILAAAEGKVEIAFACHGKVATRNVFQVLHDKMWKRQVVEETQRNRNFVIAVSNMPDSGK
jgi:ABC-type phosphate/phosphonate transport system substrate-binding protein